MTRADRHSRRHTLKTRLIVLVLMAFGAGAIGTAVFAAVAIARLSTRADEERQRLVVLADAQLARALGHDVEQLQTLASRLATMDPAADRAIAVRDAYLASRYFEAVFVADADGRLAQQEPRDLTIRVPRIAADARPGAIVMLKDCDQDQRCRTTVALRTADWEGRAPAIVGGILDPSSHRVAPLLLSIQQQLGDGFALADLDGRTLAASPHTSPGGGGSLNTSGTLPWHAVPLDERRIAAIDRWIAVPAALALGALLILFAWGGARSVGQPIEALTRASERMAAGDMDTALPDAGSDEVGRLAIAFDRMRVALRRAMGEIEMANLQLEARVEDRTRELQRLYAELQARDRVRERLLRQAISAQEDERKRIARDLHDETCQMLGAVAMRLGLAAERPSADTIADARALVLRATDGVRRQIYDLRPSALDDLGLFDALRAHATRHLDARGVEVRFETDTEPPRLSHDVELAVFRAAQELITNIERHARASHVFIELRAPEHRFVIDVEDDGVGFDWAEAQRAMSSDGGMGLLGVRERVALAGGTFTVDSAPGRGTHAHIEIPLAENGHGEDSRLAG